MIANIATSLNFSWVIERRLAGCAAPMLAQDLQFLRSQGIRGLVRMACPRKDDYVIDSSEVVATGMDDLPLPVEDFHAPTPEQIDDALTFIDSHLRAGEPVAVSCGAGCGRTGTILACYLVAQGHTAEKALKVIIEKRPCSREIIERAPSQKAAVFDFERRVRTDQAPSP